ncbi:MAG: hypothetical protein K6B68_10730 [Eubacterium sp.]|nr:hypothetical protein [Eubacterium sp.]
MNHDELVSFMDYFNNAVRIDNGIGLNTNYGINQKSKIEKRNSATTMVADLLGCGNVTGVVGIDNDTSFGTLEHAYGNSGILLENMTVITESTAKIIENLNRNVYKNMLYGFDLSTAEVA